MTEQNTPRLYDEINNPRSTPPPLRHTLTLTAGGRRGHDEPAKRELRGEEGQLADAHGQTGNHVEINTLQRANSESSSSRRGVFRSMYTRSLWTSNSAESLLCAAARSRKSERRARRSRFDWFCGRAVFVVHKMRNRHYLLAVCKCKHTTHTLTQILNTHE